MRIQTQKEVSMVVKENWEDRALQLARAEFFNARVTPSDILEIHMDLDEWVRLNKKMAIVEKSARRLAAAMLKGTLKYDSDTLTQEEWLEHLESELYDSVNYFGLMMDGKR